MALYRTILGFVIVCMPPLAASAEPPVERKAADDAPPPPAFGQPAPPIHLAKLLQAPADAPLSLDKLKGKAVVLEFWGTWCGPCVRAVPHLNDVVKDAGGEAVVFIAVTDEPADTVAAFLEKTRLSGWVGIDDKGATTRAYGVRSFPTTVLIDPDGVVQGVTDPMTVTGAVVKDLANRRPLRLAADTVPPLRTDANGGIDLGKADVLVYVGPPNDLLGDPVAGPTESKSRSCSARSLLQSCYAEEAGGWTAPRVVLEGDIPDKQVGFAVRVPQKGGLTCHALLKPAVEAALGVRTRGTREGRDQDVFVLKHVGPAAPAKPAGNPALGITIRYPRNGCVGEGAEIKFLASWIEGQTKKPVYDETGLAGPHDWRIKVKSFSADDLNGALREIGLAVTPDRRKVEYIVVRRAVDPPGK